MEELDRVLTEHATNYFAEDSLYKAYLEDRKQTLKVKIFRKLDGKQVLQAAIQYFQSQGRGKTGLGTPSRGNRWSPIENEQNEGSPPSPPLPPKSYSPPSPPLPSRSHRVTPPLPRRDLSYSSDSSGTNADVVSANVKHAKLDPPVQNVTSISIPGREQRSISAAEKCFPNGLESQKHYQRE